MTADEKKCETETCLSDACMRVHWPGKTLKMCKPCALRAVGVADAMGFSVHTEEFP